MADPMGLVSLGLRVVKKAVKHGSTVRSRHRHLKELSYAVDLAAAMLHDAEQSDDPVDVQRTASRDILIPCISDAKQFLKRVGDRKLFASTINKFGRASEDDAELKRLLSALAEAPGRIDARVLELRVSLAKKQQHDELLNLLANQQSDFRSLRSDVMRCLGITMLCGSFFG